MVNFAENELSLFEIGDKRDYQMKNYRKLLLEAIQAGNVVGILRGEKRYRIEPRPLYQMFFQQTFAKY